jgi:SecD/SecF fusion protein
MFRQNLWKLLLSIAIVIWAVAELIPLKDRPFDQYIRSEAKGFPAEFAAVMKQADTRVDSKQAPSVFVALKEIGKEQKLDLSKFFPQVRLEASLKNVERRNNILLDELLKRSKGRLQLGLDLKGGVAFTLEVAERTAAGTSPRDSEQKLSKAIEIISTRINSLGVAEPIVRPVGNNRIEVQLPGVTTKDNPEIVSSLKKPARLDFRLVHPTLVPDTTSPIDAPPGYESMLLEQEARNGEIRTSELYVKRIPEMTGEALSDAYATMDEFGRFKILLRFTKEGAKRFADVTRAIADEGKRTGRLGQLAIILDGKLYSAPSVHEEIPSGSAEITGSFSQREAIELANVLNNPLDLPLEIKEQY